MTTAHEEAILARSALLHVHRLGALSSPEERERHRKIMEEAREVIARHLPEPERAALAKWWDLP